MELKGSTLIINNDADFDKITSDHRSKVETLVIELNIIKNKSFQNFRKLEKLIINRAKRIGKGTFAGCKNLEEVFANKTVIIDGKAFEHCRKLKTLYAEVLKAIGRDAFKNCVSLENVSIPEKTYDKYKKEFKGTRVTGVMGTEQEV